MTQGLIPSHAGRRLTVAALVMLAAACSGPAASPTSPSAAAGASSATGPDGSTLKAAAPRLTGPINGATVSATPSLVAEPAVGRFATGFVNTLRFQLSQSEDFASLTGEGTASATAGGLVIYAVQQAQRAGTRIFWRARAELDGTFGPWSSTSNFMVSGSAPAQPSPGGGARTPDPPAGQRLPLPNMQAQIEQWTAERPDLFPSQQCPQGIKYVPSPWQNYIMDRLRQIDTRWGYNAKPTRTAADNGGVPVVAAGDEILYNYGSRPDEGNTSEVYAVDMLEQHCGTPRVTWRVFTGEEPVRWTGAGRF